LYEFAKNAAGFAIYSIEFAKDVPFFAITTPYLAKTGSYLAINVSGFAKPGLTFAKLMSFLWKITRMCCIPDPVPINKKASQGKQP
jgi:hypothetical protein